MKLKLRYKLVLFYIPFLVIPLIILSVYLLTVVSRNSIEQSEQTYGQSTKLLQQSVINKLESYYSIAYDIARDANMIEYLTLNQGKDYDLYQFYVSRIQEIISKAKYRDSNLLINIYTSNEKLKFSGLFIRDNQLFNEKRIHVKGITTAYWEGIVEKRVFLSMQPTTRKYLCFLMPIANYKQSTEQIGVLEVCIDLSSLEALNLKNGDEGNITFLLNDRDQPLIASTEITNGLLGATKAPSYSTVTYNNKKYLQIVDSIDISHINLHGWRIFNLIPLNYVEKNQRYIWNANLMICALCVAAAIPLLFLLSRTITKRLEYLSDRMNDIRLGEYGISIHVPGNDEVAHLGSMFNRMLQELDLLTKQAMETKLKEERLDGAHKEAQLQALQRQINPHYLFNTLESIRMYLVTKGNTEIAELLHIFSESFRVMIDGSGKTIALADEIKFIKRYFRIQEFRYEGKISLKIDVPEDFPNYMIPKFLLQPLIENAIYHGLELKDGEGSVYLAVRSDGQNLHITISDDGIGMEKDDYDSLIASLGSAEPTGKNDALRNIVQRLRLMYGDDAAMCIQSRANEGTMVSFVIPLDKLEVALDVQSVDLRGRGPYPKRP